MPKTIGYREIPNYKMTVDEDDVENIFETSFVNAPATDRFFALFNKQTKVQLKQDQSQRIVSGVWMMPDTKYYRNDGGYEYTVEIEREDLFKAYLKYLKNKKYETVKFEHQGQESTDFPVLEHWVLTDYAQKSPTFGFSLEDLGHTNEEIPLGTIFKTVYVPSEEFWNDYILTGKYNGFSIGGVFDLKKTPEMSVLTTQMFSSLGLKQNSFTTEINGLSVEFKNDICQTPIMDGAYDLSFGFTIEVSKGAIVKFYKTKKKEEMQDEDPKGDDPKGGDGETPKGDDPKQEPPAKGEEEAPKAEDKDAKKKRKLEDTIAELEKAFKVQYDMLKKMQENFDAKVEAFDSKPIVTDKKHSTFTSNATDKDEYMFVNGKKIRKLNIQIKH